MKRLCSPTTRQTEPGACLGWKKKSPREGFASSLVFRISYFVCRVLRSLTTIRLPPKLVKRRFLHSFTWNPKRDTSDEIRTTEDYGVVNPWAMAYLVSSAVVRRSSCSMICALWNSTVFGEMFSS